MFVLQQVVEQQQNNTAEEQFIFQCENVRGESTHGNTKDQSFSYLEKKRPDKLIARIWKSGD